MLKLLKKGIMMYEYDEKVKECVICGSKEIKYWGKKNYTYTEILKHVPFEIYKCDSCKSGFLNPYPSGDFIREVYKYSGHALAKPITLEEILQIEKEFPNTIVDAERLSYTLDKLNNAGTKTALDIGSGYGFYTENLNKLGYSTTSVNPGEYENTVFRELNGYLPKVGLFQDFEYEENFSVVNFSHILEHIPYPNKIISEISNLMLSGGVMVIAVPNFNSFSVRLFKTKDNSCLWVPEHLNYFTKAGLERLLNKNGMELIKYEQITRIPYMTLSNRLGVKNIFTRRILNLLVKYIQIPFAKLFNLMNMGLYINA
jgi:2-polyprenyl-3-methyl-5-hydroxy-6-metoxy-1,4-benzoquinol methylase